MNRAVPLVLLVLLAGCESDADKLQRLQLDVTIECAAARQREDVAAAYYERGDTASQRRVEEAEDSRADCTLAERELARFLR